jgi:Fe-S oxidoreductase
LLKPARAAARDTVAALAPFARRGLPIIGLEPSCLLSLRDEYLYLLPGNIDARLVAEHSVLFEEFVADLASRGELHVTFSEEEKTILLHGHCHEKALVGTEISRSILQLPPNYHVQEIDSACCGMAGAFGYEVEHLEISMAMGELRLFPTIRQAETTAVIAASGFSCRSQIKHGTGREALHPAQILRRALRT